MCISRKKLLLKLAKLRLGKDEVCEELGESLVKKLLSSAEVILSYHEAQLLIAMLGAENTFAVMSFGGNILIRTVLHRAVFG